MRQRRTEDEDGFTLIELLIVIVILGVLAAIVVFAIGGISDRGNTSACKADSKTIETAIEAYRAKYNADPASLTALVDSKLLRDDANVTATTKTGEGYTLTYASGELTDCDTALATGGTPGGGSGGGPSATPSATPSVSTVTVDPANLNSSGSFQTLTINGSGFVSGATVSISPALNSTGAPTVVSSTQITVTVKATGGNAGAHTMTVTNPDSGSGSGTLTVS